MMSSEEESKSDASLDCTGHSARKAAEAVPSDAWSVVLQYNTVQDSMSLSSTCVHLRDVVLRNITSIKLQRTPTAFPAARFTSLQYAAAKGSAKLAKTLPALRGCEQLRKLELFCFNPAQRAAVVSNIPLFPRLQSICLRFPVVNGELGKALAACTALRDVKLFVSGAGQRSYGRTDYVADFLRELTALPTLRSLDGLHLRDEDDASELRVAVGAWEELEELVVARSPDWDAGEELHVPLDDIAVAVSASCPRLRMLSLHNNSVRQVDMAREDAEAIGRMKQLRELRLTDGLSAACLAPLRTLPKLEQLRLTSSTMDEEAAAELVTAVAQLPLQELTLSDVSLPPAKIEAMLQAVTAHACLRAVGLYRVAARLDAAQKERVGAALGDAFCRSSAVVHWTFDLPSCLLPFLHAWDGRTPAAAVRKVSFNDVDCHACADEEHVLLLLRCLRSCASLRQVSLGSWPGSADALVAGVRAEPVAPTLLSVQLAGDKAVEYEGLRKELRGVGLRLH
eukprot:PLAT4962.2.p1 GENE.PLAT4962.2~~PLAT4962.2.p1  ORF type:complete len:510 (+),score=123.28 PLAT4962.2:238-1767(+)